MAASGRYYDIQAAFTGSESQVGPLVDSCKMALGMETVGKHGHHELLEVSKCTILPGCQMSFLDSQVNAIGFMVQRSYGKIPVSESRAGIPEVKKACDTLRSIRTFGGYVVDVTGFGKTDVALAFASFHALYGDHSDGHRPTLIVTPNGAVYNQWVKKIYDNYHDLNLIISNDDKPSDAKYLLNWVSSTAMREAPIKLDNWPAHLRYIFDHTNPEASKAVIISPFDSHSGRTMNTVWTASTSGVRTKKKRSARQAIAKTKDRKDHPGEEPLFVTKWRGRFGVVLCDEGHKIRHIVTKIHASIHQLEAKVNWLLTATPIMNTSMVRSHPHINLKMVTDGRCRISLVV